MIQPPPDMGLFQFVVISTLRAKQLVRGCVPRVNGSHKVTVTAQIEVAEGKVAAVDGAVAPPPAAPQAIPLLAAPQA